MEENTNAVSENSCVSELDRLKDKVKIMNNKSKTEEDKELFIFT